MPTLRLRAERSEIRFLQLPLVLVEKYRNSTAGNFLHRLIDEFTTKIVSLNRRELVEGHREFRQRSILRIGDRKSFRSQSFGKVDVIDINTNHSTSIRVGVV